jgi:Txe/YoeB family toxin of Txe-Axe toxin-antitoxin module
MKVKVNDEGVVVLGSNSMPIWVTEDGSEVEYDVPGLVADLNKTKGYLTEAQRESAGRRKEIDSLKENLVVWEGIDPEEAKKALTTIKNFDESKYVAAGEVEKIKTATAQTYEERIEKQRKELQEAIAERDKKLSAKEQAIRRMMVKSIFDQSKFLSEQTVLPPDMAYKSFGDYFEVVEDNTDLRVVAKYNGDEIFSKARPGELATPEEALMQIIDRYQFKDSILKSSGASGSGSSGSGGKINEPSSLEDSFYPSMAQSKRPTA